MKKILSIASIGLGLLIGATGCLKDKDFDNNKFGISKPDASPVGVGFPEAANKINTFSVLPSTSPQTFKVALVNLLSDMPAEEDLTITLQRDTSIAYNYNNDPDTKTPVVEFDAAALASTYKVFIPKGQRTGYLDLTIVNSSTLDLTKLYGVGLKIVSVDKSGVTISTNLQKVLIGVAIQNIYDGVYSGKCYILRGGDPAKTGSFSFEIALATNGPTSVIFKDYHKWADGTNVGIDYPIFTIDPATNAVTVSSQPATPLAVPVANAPGYNSRYEPATKTIYASYTWNAGPTARLIIDTLTYLKPR